jgi:F-type H+-transporting ATPase subunit epsilon
MYHLFIATPEKVAFDDDVESTIAPGAAGYLEILTGHAPIVCALTAGKVTIKDTKGKKSVWAISGGYLESSENKATILADTIEPASEIDLARAERAQKRAEKRIESNDPEVDVPRAKEALQRAKNRIAIGKSYKKEWSEYIKPH